MRSIKQVFVMVRTKIETNINIQMQKLFGFILRSQFLRILGNQTESGKPESERPQHVLQLSTTQNIKQVQYKL